MGAAGSGAGGGGIAGGLCAAPATARQKDNTQVLNVHVQGNSVGGGRGGSVVPADCRLSLPIDARSAVPGSPAGAGAKDAGSASGPGFLLPTPRRPAVRPASVQLPAVAPPTGEPATTGLAARRKFAPRLDKDDGVVQRTGKDDGPRVCTDRAVCVGQGAGRCIRAIRDIAREYVLGDEVMPSCHRGMKVVYATHNVSGADVVIKVRTKDKSFDNKKDEYQWRSTTEYMMSLTACSNIARLYEVLEDNASYYVVMEKVSGQDLFESISGQGLLPTTEVKEIVAQILAALVDLHGAGRIHKDLKLENIMLDRTPTSAASTRTPTNTSSGSFWDSMSVPTSPVSVKLIDFDTVEEYCPETPKRTKDVLGTDQYIAQEAYDGNYSPASDIFAVGVIAYRLCTGRFPFSSDIFDDKPGENWVGSPKMKEIQGKLRMSKIRWKYEAFEKEPRACDLLRAMLAVREVDRPQAKEALAHPWLASTAAALASVGICGTPPATPSRPYSRAWRSEGGSPRRRPPATCWGPVNSSEG